MGEDLEIIDVDVRQRKAGKNKNQNDDIVISSGGGGDGGHGLSKRRRRGRGGDRSEGIKVIPEEEVSSEPKERKGKVVINKKPESDDIEDDTDDAYDSSLEDEESSGSWLFKLIIIAIVVSLGFSLMWLNDGSSLTDLDASDADVESLNDITESYNSEKVDSEKDTNRADIESEIESANYQVYQDSQEYHQQWSQEYSDSSSNSPEIIAEVSETIGEPSSDFNDETEYQDSRDEGYFESTVSDQQESMKTGTWTNEQDNQPENRAEEQSTSFQEPELVNPNQQSDHNYDQQTWQYQEQIVQRELDEQSQQQDPQIVPAKTYESQPYEAYEQNNDELAQSSVELSPEIPETREYEPVVEERYYECPEGSYWDGLSCVNPETFVQLDDFNNAYEKQPENTGENIFHPDQ